MHIMLLRINIELTYIATLVLLEKKGYIVKLMYVYNYDMQVDLYQLCPATLPIISI